MHSEEQRLIDELFSRLQQAEHNSVPRDEEADSAINAHVRNQPGAPYYMAQTILIQEAALRQLNDKVANLEQQLSALQNQKPASGGFLAGLFGAGRPEVLPQTATRAGAPIPGIQGNSASRYTPEPAMQPATVAPARSGFMAGALQTAAGVAGGVMLGNMLTGLFHSSQPDEVVNIIEEPPQSVTPDAAPADIAASDQNDGWLPARYDDTPDNNVAINDDNDFGSNGNDDSSWF